MKHEKNKRKAGMITVSMMMGTFLFFTGCGKEAEHASLENGKVEHEELENDKNAEETLAWQQYAEEPITFDWYVNYSWFNQEWGDNAVSKKITEETGVSIDFLTPNGNESEKMNALIASDSLPDFITLGWWEPQVNVMIERDMVYALNELADAYDMYFWEVSDPDAVNWYTKSDGNIYCYPNSSITAKDLENHEISSNQTFLVRKDIYEAIGSPDMTTPEGFKAAVKKAVEMFPEVDGEPLIPIGAHEFNEEGCESFDNYLMNFLAVPFEVNGEIYDRYTDTDYITWLKMFRELGEEGLLASDIFIDQRTQMEEKLSNGRYFCMIYQYTDILGQQKELMVNAPERIYIAVDGPKNANGDDHTLTTTGINGWTVTLISKNCEQPERAIAFLNYMMSEHGQMRLCLGVEGETFDYVDGKPVVKAEVQELLNSNRAEYDRIYGADDTYWMMQNDVIQLQWKQEEPEAVAQLKNWSLPYAVYNGQYDSFLLLDSQEAYIDAKITSLWSETLPKLLMAESEEKFDEIFAQFLEKRDASGYEALQLEKNKLMKQAKEKLGID